MLEKYNSEAAERAKLGIPPLPLTAEYTAAFVEMLKNNQGDQGELVDLISNRVPAGVDEASKVKADFLYEVAKGEVKLEKLPTDLAYELLSYMSGGYAVEVLVDLLADPSHADKAAGALKSVIHLYDSFSDIAELAKKSDAAKKLIESWANAEWFKKLPEMPETIDLVVYKVDGELNTDDFSPAQRAGSRADIPLHALYMGEKRFPDGLEKINELKKTGRELAFVGDVVGTGSSRKSATNSLLWHIGNDIKYVPNKRRSGVILGGIIAPIFFETVKDAGAIPIECDVSQLNTGDEITLDLKSGKLTKSGATLCEFEYRPTTLPDEYRAGGRLNLVIGKDLVEKSRKFLGLGESTDFISQPVASSDTKKGYTRAQKIVGRAAGKAGVRPGETVQVKTSTVISQDTTGPMTMDELKELSCLKFSTDFVLQSFCHTAAYPTKAEVNRFTSMADFFTRRGGVALNAGDGIVHSWVNRLVLPDTLGTGGDSHTRYSLGVFFPSGSGLTAFAAALGFMPLQMPESVLVRFKGELRPGVTLRDLVNATAYEATKMGLLELGKKNIFSGKVLEIEGLEDLTVEQAFEFTNASAERSASASVIKLSEKSISEFLQSSIRLMKKMIAEGYQDPKTIQKRIDDMEKWLANPEILSADPDAEYAAVIEVDLNDYDEPVLACPNNPDSVKKLSEIEESEVHEVFIGSCMTNISHFRAAGKIFEGKPYSPTALWMSPPTNYDQETLLEEGYYRTYAGVGARMEIPGCSLCMGNQARVRPNTTVVSTSTRNFNNRMGEGARVYLSSAEVAAMTATLGRLPTKDEYFEIYNESVAPHMDEINVFQDFIGETNE